VGLERGDDPIADGAVDIELAGKVRDRDSIRRAGDHVERPEATVECLQGAHRRFLARSRRSSAVDRAEHRPYLPISRESGRARPVGWVVSTREYNSEMY